MRCTTFAALALLGLCALGGALAVVPVSTACAKGDLPCSCAAVSGKWRELNAPLQSTCTVTFKHQGRLTQRLVVL